MTKFIQDKKNSIILFIFIFLGIILRFKGLTFQSYWLDELYSATVSNPDKTLLSVWKELVNVGVHPPLYQLILYGWYKIFGFSEFSGRSLSTFIGSLGVICMYFLGKEIYNKKVGLYSLIIASTNVFLIYFSQEVRSYSLLFLLTVLSFIYFFKFIKKFKRKYISLYLLITILMIYTHYFGFYVLIAQFFIYTLYWVKLKEKQKYLIVVAGIALLAIIISLLPLRKNLLRNLSRKSFWIICPPPAFVVYYIKYYFRNVYLIIVYFYVSLISLFSLFNKRDKTDFKFKTIILLIWIGSGYILPYLESVISVPILTVRNTIIVVPAIIVFLAFGVYLIGTKKQGEIIVAIIVFLSIFQLYYMGYYNKINKEQWREVFVDANKINNKIPMFDIVFNGYGYSTYADMLGMDFHIYSIDSLQSDYNSGFLPDSFWVLDAHGDNIAQSELLKNKGLRQVYKISHYEACGVLYSYTPEDDKKNNLKK
ncbi:glycosyltransferase family 39 protein [bacterium]|nr:glycosyltransferase family 39 protein [bacterium]